MMNFAFVALLAGALQLPVAVPAQTGDAQVKSAVADPRTNPDHGNSLSTEQTTLPSAQEAPKAGACRGCSQDSRPAGKPDEVPAVRPIPGTKENMPVGRVENLIPIGVVTALGCEKCAEEVVGWALQQGSSFEEIDRALRTVEAMQKLDCFNRAFGPDVARRLEKPLAAGRRALQQAMDQAAR